MNAGATWITNRTIADRFRLILFIQIIALCIIIGAIALITPQLADGFEQLDHARIDLLQATTIETESLEARRREKDFFLRYNNIGYQDAVDIYVTSHDESIAQVLGAAKFLSDESIHDDDTESENTDLAHTIESLVTTYNDLFRDITDDLIPERTLIIDEMDVLFTQLNEEANF